MILNVFLISLGKFAQRSNLSKTEQIEDPQIFFDYLTSDEVTVLDADLVSDEIIEIRYEYGDKFVQPNPNTNVVIAAFTTAYARLQLYDELDMLGERALYYDTDSSFILVNPANPNLDWAITLATSPTNWAASTSRYLRRAVRRITATKPAEGKSISKYAGLRWIVRRGKR